MSSNFENDRDGATGRKNPTQESVSPETHLENRSLMATMDPVNVGQFFVFSPSDGTITNRLSKSRMLLLNSEIWSDVERELIRIFASAGLVILDNIGHAYGTSFAKKIKSQSSTPTIGVLQSLASAAGWGKLSVTADEKEGSWIRVISNHCVFCDKSTKGHEKDECMFLSGLIRGLAEEFYDKNYMVLRNKCFHSGLHSCEIVLQETPRNAPT